MKMVMAIIWEIWRERNARIFQQQEKTTATIISEVQETIKLALTLIKIFRSKYCKAATAGEYPNRGPETNWLLPCLALKQLTYLLVWAGELVLNLVLNL